MTVKSACLLAALAALMALFVALAPRLDDGANSKSAIAREESALSALERFRIERSATRETEFKELMSIMTDESVNEEIRRDAGIMRLELIENMEKEATVEGTLMARGFEDVLCTVHADSVNVLVKTESLSQPQSAVIMELTVRETKREAKNIKIIPVSGH